MIFIEAIEMDKENSFYLKKKAGQLTSFEESISANLASASTSKKRDNHAPLGNQ